MLYGQPALAAPVDLELLARACSARRTRGRAGERSSTKGLAQERGLRKTDMLGRAGVRWRFDRRIVRLLARNTPSRRWRVGREPCPFPTTPYRRVGKRTRRPSIAI